MNNALDADKLRIRESMISDMIDVLRADERMTIGIFLEELIGHMKEGDLTALMTELVADHSVAELIVDLALIGYVETMTEAARRDVARLN